MAPAAELSRDMCDACYATALLTPYKWDGPVTYGLPLASDVYGYPGEPETLIPLSGDLAAAARSAAAQWAVVAKIGLAELPGGYGADILIGIANIGGAAFAHYPSGIASAGDIWLSEAFFGEGGIHAGRTAPGSYTYLTFLHEFGHALGLRHPHGDFVGADVPKEHRIPYTVMSYVGVEERGMPTSPMMLDILAVQTIYGPNWDHNAGDTVYRWSPKAKPFETIWDGGGTDTLDFRDHKADLTISLAPGGWSKLHSGKIANALLFEGDMRSLIENVIGGRGDDEIAGNAADNVLRGGKGENIFFGDGGADTFVIKADRSRDKILDYNPSEGDTIVGGEIVGHKVYSDDSVVALIDV